MLEMLLPSYPDALTADAGTASPVKPDSSMASVSSTPGDYLTKDLIIPPDIFFIYNIIQIFDMSIKSVHYAGRLKDISAADFLYSGRRNASVI